MKYFFSLLLTCSIQLTFTQKAQNAYFLMNDGREVSTLDSADYTRVIKEPDSGLVNYELYEYHKNKKLKRIGYVSAFEPLLVLEGYIRNYYPNGNIKEISNYVRNEKSGESSLFFENGVIKEKRIYRTIPSNASASINGHTDFSDKYYLVKYLGDSLGYSFLDTNGTGTFQTTTNKGNIISETYHKGLKHGDWKTICKEDGSITEETYVNATFIRGVRRESTGLIKEYLNVEETPKFKDGLVSFAKYFAKNFRYSPEARQQGVSGKVLVSFVVESDGSIADVKVLRDLGLGTGEETVRVLRASSKWSPGLQHGKPVRFAYILPFSLNLEIEEERAPRSRRF